VTGEILSYNIHDVLKIQLKRSKKLDLMRGFDLELFPFGVEDVTDPDIIFNVGKFNPSNDNCYIVDHKYYVKDNYFYCKDSAGKVKWEVEIFGFEEGTTVVNFNYKASGLKSTISRISIETFLLRPIIYYKLSEKGYFMIHAAGVSKDGEALIFPGRGGAFKTSLVMDFVKRTNFSYLGDDRVILHRDKVLSFPAHFPLFEYTYRMRQDEHLSFFDKINFVISLWRNKNYNGTVPLTKMAKLKAVFFIVKCNSMDGIFINELSLKEAVTKLVRSSKMEMSSVSDTLVGFSSGPYYRYMLAYSYVFPNSKVHRYWNILWKNFEGILQKLPVYEIELPKKYSVDIFSRINRVMEEIT